MDIGAWLRGLGLEQYARAFSDNAIDSETLAALTGDDLRELGVAAIGHRKRLLAAIAALGLPRPSTTPRTEAIGLPTQPQPVAPTPSGGERRHLTVMFVDLVGSTELSRRLDPEEMREVIRAYHDTVAGEIATLDGYVAKLMGDGVLVYFGWPQSHEDDAERSVRAALAIVGAVARLASPAGKALAARIGIATGLVVVGDLIGEGAAQEAAVVGETPNLAARLQSLAEPGGVVIAQGTRTLLSGLFDLADLGTHDLKGYSEPVRAWRVVRKGAAESRFEALHGRWLTPLVGREQELALLLERWRRTKEGEGQVVLVSGEAGIGKSRITEVLRERLMADDHIRLRFQCSPYHTNSALYPIIEHLERAAGFERNDGPEVRLTKLETLMGLAGANLAEAVPLIAALLGVPAGDHYPPLAMSPERQKDRTLQTLADQAIGLSVTKPVLMIVEDAHWIDPTTQESVDLTIGRAEGARLLVVVTGRPEYRPNWLGRGNATTVVLNRLSKRQGVELVEGVMGGISLPSEVLDQVVAKTDGVPLFVEELTRMVTESGILREQDGRYVLDGPLPPLAIPATLHDSLMARLDRLAPAKEVAQAGAAIGRTFRHDLLAAVLTRPDADLRAALEQLVDAGLVFRQGTGTDAAYTFKHALVQDAAHGSLLKSQRQRLHARIATMMEKQFPEEAAAAAEVVAQHYAEGGLDESAVEWWARAGRQAFERSMNVEAIASLRKALAILDARSDRVGTQELELDILIALGAAVTAVHGYASAETQRIARRAREVCRDVRDVDRVIPVLYGEWSTLAGLGQYDEADNVAKELAQFLMETSSNQFNYIPSVMLAYVHMLRGNLKDSDYFYELAQSQYVCNDGYDVASKLTEHPGALIHTLWTQTKLCLGQYDIAYKSMLTSIEQTTQSRHVNSIGLTKCFAAFHLLERGLFDEALKTCDDANNYAVENSLTIWQAANLVIKGLVISRLDRNANGVEIARQGLSDWLATGTKGQAAQLQSYFVQACLFGGRIEEAETALRAAFEIANETGEKWYSAELYRLQGDARLAQRPALSSEAEACYQSALNLSRDQHAKTFELRAAMSLARLWAERGERQRAHDLLAPVYSWFTEGLGTRDLVEAKALLDVLH